GFSRFRRLRPEKSYVRQRPPLGSDRPARSISRSGIITNSGGWRGSASVAAGFRRLLRSRALAQDDTLVSGVAGRYASALFSLAQDNRQTEAVAQSLGKLDALIVESPDLQRLVRSPVFSANDQLKALDAVLAEVGIDGIAANFVRLVAAKRRLFSIRDMIAAYRKLYDANRGVTHAAVISATT